MNMGTTTPVIVENKHVVDGVYFTPTDKAAILDLKKNLKLQADRAKEAYDRSLKTHGDTPYTQLMLDRHNHYLSKLQDLNTF